jgi:hypothetical protein
MCSAIVDVRFVPIADIAFELNKEVAMLRSTAAIAARAPG